MIKTAKTGEVEKKMKGVKISRLMLILFLGTFIAIGYSCSSVTEQIEEPILVGDVYKKTVNVVCSNSLTSMIMEVAFEISTATENKVLEGVPNEFTVTGKAYFPAELLSMAVQFIEGLNEITLEDLQVTVIVRSGAEGGPVVLGSSVATPVIFTIPPVTTDEQTCEDAGMEFGAPCVLEGMEMQLDSQKVTLTPGTAGTNILIGLDESQLPPTFFPVEDPLGPNGFRVSITVGEESGILGLDCYMGNLVGESDAEALPDSDLLAIPIE